MFSTFFFFLRIWDGIYSEKGHGTPIRQTLQPTGVCLSRATFSGLYARFLKGDKDTVDAWYGRWMLGDYCRSLDLPINARSGYPRQPRPFDLVERYLDRLLGCVATPKADAPRGIHPPSCVCLAVRGTEAFLFGHAYGVTLWVRTGTVRLFPWTGPRAYPFLLEGEMFGSELFVAYDCALSPVTRYGVHGRFATRHAAMVALLARLDGRFTGLTVRSKPYFVTAHHPHRAIRRCKEWSQSMGLPCDGVVFVDDTTPGYNRTERLWKLKDAGSVGRAGGRSNDRPTPPRDVPTVDFAVFPAGPDLPGVFEIMLRGSKGMLQSLHRFRCGDREYVAPVLIRPPSATNLRDSQVVELTVRTVSIDNSDGNATAVASVSFPSLACRETGNLK